MNPVAHNSRVSKRLVHKTNVEHHIRSRKIYQPQQNSTLKSRLWQKNVLYDYLLMNFLLYEPMVLPQCWHTWSTSLKSFTQKGNHENLQKSNRSVVHITTCMSHVFTHVLTVHKWAALIEHSKPTWLSLCGAWGQCLSPHCSQDRLYGLRTGHNQAAKWARSIHKKSWTCKIYIKLYKRVSVKMKICTLRLMEWCFWPLSQCTCSCQVYGTLLE